MEERTVHNYIGNARCNGLDRLVSRATRLPLAPTIPPDSLHSLTLSLSHAPTYSLCSLRPAGVHVHAFIPDLMLHPLYNSDAERRNTVAPATSHGRQLYPGQRQAQTYCPAKGLGFQMLHSLKW